MRFRLGVMLALVLALPLTSALTTAAQARSHRATITLAQTGTDEDEPAVGDQEEQQRGEVNNSKDEGKGSDAETGASEGEQGDAAEETGPVWTYQMSKIVLVLMVFILLGIGGAYWRFVYQRQRSGV